MTYNLNFDERALEEWQKLDNGVRTQLKKKLAKIIIHPKIPKARLSGLPNCYKIKLKRAGIRLVYQVQDETITVFVLTVGKRADNAVYDTAHERISPINPNTQCDQTPPI